MNPFRFAAQRLSLFIAAMALCLSAARGDTIGFFYALDADLQGLKSLAQESGQSTKVGTRSIQRLQLDTHAIYAVRMGAGAVETATSAQALLSRFRCDWAFSLGPAGALSDAVETGRWYRVDRALAWQRGAPESAENEAVPSWKTPWNRIPVATLPEPFRSSPAISVASGEQFISTAGERDRLQAATQADAVDMNSFGLAAVCADHGVPLFSWKIVSDQADENASENFRAFVSTYSGEGGRALAEVIRSLPANPNDPASYPAIDKLLREHPPPPGPSP